MLEPGFHENGFVDDEDTDHPVIGEMPESEENMPAKEDGSGFDWD